MKTKLLRLCSFILITATFLACPSKASETFPENLSWDFCETDCAVDCSEDYLYNTDEGSAYFTIPIPDGATLSSYKVVNNGQTVEFTCSNSKYQGKIVNVSIKIPAGKLAKNKGGQLAVNVAFEDYECGIVPKATRNKGSVLQGNPGIDVCFCK